MIEADLDALYAQQEAIDAAPPPLYIALGLAVLAVLGLITSSPVLGIIGWMGAWLIGLFAVSRAAHAANSNPGIKYPLMLCTFVPVLSLIPPAYYLLTLKRVQAELAQALERSHERANRGAMPNEAAANPAAADPNKVNALQALPIVRSVADLSGTAEGGVLKPQLVGELGRTLANDYPDAELPPLRATAGVFAVGYRVDAGSTWRSVNQSEAKLAGMNLEQLHKRSLANLMALVKGQPGLRVHASEPYAGLLLDGDHEHALVLLDGVWDAFLKKQTPNGAVVAIPFRDVLMFCDAASAPGIAAMRAKLRELANEPKLISLELLLRREGRWQIFKG